MTQVTLEEVTKLQTELTNYPNALAALQEIEECEGDLEDAAMVLAIRAGQQPDIANAEWLSSLAKKCRAFICRQELRSALANESFAPVVEQLTAAKICPTLLVMPVLLYVVKQGVDEFCQPLDPVA
ncbi:hypothetical protein [Chroococcidiopsis sp.]|uniref:hypothetical protein n=1 Tax=Chroococcidiopsis sp. TaxID=3088168 RepID=UPI000B70E72A|nr:hypothetical protein B7486_25630 [cyanobacterium TDX16]